MSDKLVRLKNAAAIGDKGDIRLTVETEDGELDVKCDRADIASVIEYLLKAASICPQRRPMLLFHSTLNTLRSNAAPARTC